MLQQSRMELGWYRNLETRRSSVKARVLCGLVVIQLTVWALFVVIHEPGTLCTGL